MKTADIIVAITTLLTQAENGYHLSKNDIEQAEQATDLLQQLIIKAKQVNQE